jgi:glycine cleavage system aminomethyltransferase T
MTRAQLSGLAMAALIRQGTIGEDGVMVYTAEDRSKLIAQRAVKFADALLAELSKQPE